MTEKLITPKFLTVDMARAAVGVAFNAVFHNDAMRSALHPLRPHCHVVILVPGMVDHVDADYPDWPDYPLKPVCLYEESRGDPAKFENPIIDIAQCKALQLWTDRNDDRTDIQPHLLFRGDTIYWGGVKRRGIVVTCSGQKPVVDKLISGITADTLVCQAATAWAASDDFTNKVAFLT